MVGRRSDNILIIKTDGLAAFVAAEPLFEAIRAAHPGARISLLTQQSLQRIAQASSYFDRVAAMPDFRDPAARKAFVQQIRNSRFAVVYDLAGDDEAKRLQAAMGPFRPKWRSIDARKPKKGMAPEEWVPDIESLAATSGFEAPQRLPDFKWALAVRKDSANMQPGWFGISGVFGLLMPGADETRRWPAARYGELARMMAKASIQPVMIGAKELHGFADDASNSAPEIVDLTGKTDHLQLTALAQEAAFFVTDSAEEAHLALSVGCAGVMIRKAGEENLAPRGRHIMTLTTKGDLSEATPEFVWRSLNNMGLIPRGSKSPRAAVR